MILVTVTGTFLHPNGQPCSGYVMLTPRPQTIADTAGDDLIVSTPVAAALDLAGSFSMQVVASNDPNLAPTGWTYQVTEQINGRPARSYDVNIVSPGPHDLFDLAPVPYVPSELRLIPGPQGIQGIQGNTGAAGAVGPSGALGEFALTAGTSNISRELMNTSTAVTSTQVLRLSYFPAQLSETSTQVRVQSGSTAAGATPTLVRMGLYSIAGNGDGTLIASTPNDTTLLAAALTAYTKSWSSQVGIVAGTKYAFGLLVVTAAAAPTMCGMAIASSVEAAIAPRMSGQITGQADLPSTFTAASVAVSGNYHYAALL